MVVLCKLDLEVELNRSKKRFLFFLGLNVSEALNAPYLLIMSKIKSSSHDVYITLNFTRKDGPTQHLLCMHSKRLVAENFLPLHTSHLVQHQIPP